MIPTAADECTQFNIKIFSPNLPLDAIYSVPIESDQHSCGVKDCIEATNSTAATALLWESAAKLQTESASRGVAAFHVRGECENFQLILNFQPLKSKRQI